MHSARIAFALLLSLGACKSTCTSRSSKPTEDAAAQIAAKTINAAYILSPNKITVVEDGRVTELDSDRWEWKRALGSDGSLYLAGDGVRRLRGQVTTKLSDEGVFDVAVGPDGKVWVTVRDGVLVIDGETTKKLPTPMPLSTLVVTQRGPVFAERLSISTLEGETWKKDEEASRLLANAGKIRGMTSTPNGQVYVVAMGMFLRRDAAGTWHEHKLTDLGWTRLVGRASPKGMVPLLMAQDVALIGPDGAVHRRALDLPGDLSDITAVALDGSDRLWISATFGLFIFGPDDKLLQQWPSGAIPTSAQDILIHGEGPALPGTPPPAIKGLVKGTAIVDGKPVANATVEMIAQPALAGFDRAKVRLSSTTNDAGEFTFVAVPRQEYVLTHKAGEQYASANIMSRCCWDFTPGETRDLGQVELR